MENYIVINGKKCELTPEQLEILGIEVKKPNPFEIPKSTKGVDVYCISDSGYIRTNHSPSMAYCEDLSKVGNLCTDRSLMQQRAYHEILNRLLWRYSIEHDLDGDGCTKYYIQYNYSFDKWEVGYCTPAYYNSGEVYFNDEYVARNAIKEVVKPFMEAHPGFRLQ